MESGTKVVLNKMEMARLKEKLLEKIDASRDLGDKEVYEEIENMVVEEYKGRPFSIGQKERAARMLFNSVRGLDFLEDLLADENITEIMLNGPKKVFVEEDGKLRRYFEELPSEERLQDIIQRIVAKANKRVNEASPIVDTRLPDGSRVNAVLAPAAIGGPYLTIRKFPKHAISMDELIRLKSITREAATFLESAVKKRANIFVSGGTGTGKTTFLNALSEFIPRDERIITIEDSAELQLGWWISNLVSLECRQANVEGENEITIRDLIKASLRMRPDRIIVGEVRGEEALDMLQAMNTGHDGSLSTGHANSAEDMLSRLETMVLMGNEFPLEAIRAQIASALDFIVHLTRMSDGSRKVEGISEVLGMKDRKVVLKSIFKLSDDGRNLRRLWDSADILKESRDYDFQESCRESYDPMYWNSNSYAFL